MENNYEQVVIVSEFLSEIIDDHISKIDSDIDWIVKRNVRRNRRKQKHAKKYSNMCCLIEDKIKSAPQTSLMFVLHDLLHQVYNFKMLNDICSLLNYIYKFHTDENIITLNIMLHIKQWTEDAEMFNNIIKTCQRLPYVPQCSNVLLKLKL